MNYINDNLKYTDNYLDPNILKKMHSKLMDFECPWPKKRFPKKKKTPKGSHRWQHKDEVPYGNVESA